MKIANVYRPVVVACRPDDTLDVAARHMTVNDVGALAVVDDEELVGILSERDVVLALARESNPGRTLVAHYATADVEVARPEEDSLEVARRMLTLGVRHLPVVEGDVVRGMVSMRDLLAVEALA